jgi:hypothetical protein
MLFVMNVDVKALGDLMKSVGPTDEHRQKFGQTFLGTLLGQTIVLVSMIGIYAAAGVLLWKFAKEDLKDILAVLGVFWLGLFIVAPPICIFLFSMLPALWRARRERRLKEAAIGGDLQFKAGYFRLLPYGEADREAFKRLDDADATILNWLRSAKASVLYLSGASGVGKSSLLAAGVLPKLRESGWAIVQTRLFGAPVERLRAAVVDDVEGLFARKPSADLPLRDLLKRAAEVRRKIGAPPLLLVIDQFEEFLILHKEEEREAFAAVLRDLVKNPVAEVRLLLVFRSDYLPLLLKLDLPPLVAAENWQQIAPYDRGKATSFVQSGGRELSPGALDALFRGLDRIEGTPGLYRTITLNMVGLVLERMGRMLEDDPGRLIQSYLKASLTGGLSRDFAKPLLASMITDAGTKQPRSEADLATLTGLRPSQVGATLVDLARQGLVRRLEGAPPVWEIAHDFLARIIGQLIGRLKPNVFERARPLVAPIMMLGWADKPRKARDLQHRAHEPGGAAGANEN